MDAFQFVSSVDTQKNKTKQKNTRLQDYVREENPEETSVQQLGLEMIFHLHALQQIDQLREYHLKRKRLRHMPLRNSFPF